VKLCNSKKGVSTNSSGVYAITIDANTKCFTVSGVGLQSQTISIKESNTIDVKTIASITDLDEVILVVPHHRYCKRGCPNGCGYYCSQKVVQKDSVKILPKKVQQTFTKESLKIYPNPATKNSIIYIIIKDAGEYALHFFDAQSRLLTVKNIVTNANNQTTEFQLPSTVAIGTYFIKILNEKTKKQVTEKIIVQ
jgi:hypothetical protein